MNSSNWVEAAINLEFVEQPGTGFTYCTANTQLLSAIPDLAALRCATMLNVTCSRQAHQPLVWA
ncbi:MAG: hypothetical protein U0559_02835 [Anaerolineae bacterium]